MLGVNRGAAMLAPGAREARRWVAALGLLSRNACLYVLAEGPMAFGAGAFATVYNLYILTLGHDSAFLGLLLTAALVGAGAAALPAGALVDRHGARRVLLLSAPLAGAGVATQLLTGNPVVLLASSLVAGAGGGAYYVAAAPFPTQNSPPGRRTDVFTIDMAMVLAASAAGSAGAGQLAFLFRGAGGFLEANRYWLTLLCAAGVASTSYIWLMMTDDMTDDGPPGAGVGADGGAPDVQEKVAGGVGAVSWRAALLDASVVRFAAVVALTGLGTGLFLPYLNLYFIEVLDANAAVFGWLSAVATALRLLATLLAPRLATRFGPVNTTAWAQLTSLPPLLLLGFAPHVALAGAAMLLRRAVMNMVAPIQTSFMMDTLRPEIRGAGNSVVWLASSAATGVSVLGGGALIAVAGYRLPYVLTAALYATAALLYLHWFGGSGGRATPPVAQERTTAAQLQQADTGGHPLSDQTPARKGNRRLQQ